MGDNPVQRSGSTKSATSAKKIPPLVNKTHPDGGWGWMVVLGAALCHFLLVGMARSLGVFYVAWTENYEGSAAATAWVQSLFNTVRMVIGPGVSILCDKFGARAVVMTGGIIFCGGCALSAFATSLNFLYLSFSLLAGLGAGFVFTPIFIMVNQYFDKKKGIAMSLATMGSGLGTLALAPLETFLLQEMGYFGTMLIIGGIMLNNSVSGALFRPITSPLNQFTRNKDIELQLLGASRSKASHNGGDGAQVAAKDSDEAPVAAGSDAEASQEILPKNGRVAPKEDPTEESAGENDKKRCKGLSSQMTLLKNVSFWFYCLYITALPCAIQVYLVYTPSIMEEMGLSKNQSALVMVITGASDIVGRVLSGFLFDLKWCRTRRWPVHCGFGMALGVVVLCNGFQSSLTGFVTVALLWGLTEGGYHSQRATILSEFIPKEQISHTVGFMIFSQGIGNMAWPTLAGFLKDEFGTFRVSFWFGGSMLIVCSAIFFLNYVVVTVIKNRNSKKNATKDKPVC